jgi:iron complex outermembrane receptor protein
VLSRWTRKSSEDNQISLQLYWDFFQYDSFALSERRNNGDIQFQQNLKLDDSNRFVWGLRYWVTGDELQNGGVFTVRHSERIDHLVSTFVQDEIQIVPDRLRLDVGSKLDFNDFTGFEVQPSVRFSYTPDESQTVWSSISRAVRTPSRLENDVATPVAGNGGFESETLIAYELGYRDQVSESLSFDAAAFINDYDNLVTVDQGLVENSMQGTGIGGELTARWRALSSLRFELDYSYLNLDMSLDSNSNDVSRLVAVEGSDPHHTLIGRALWDVAEHWELDTSVRYVDDLGGLGVPSYTVADIRLGWRPSQRLDISLLGRDLFNSPHYEFGSFQATKVEPSVLATVTVRF